MKSKNEYSLPFGKDTLTVSISDPKVHYSTWGHAVDFLLQYDVPILAVAKGKVVNVKNDSDVGGDDEKFADIKYQNYITIKHENEEYSQYVHIAYEGSLVKEGDMVEEGQPIAKGIGMIGYTTSPHLHFMVFIVKDNEDGFESLEINWKNNNHKTYKDESVFEEIQKSKYNPLREAVAKAQI
ncbi:M23 family metallopeptidase [Candidatus Pacearchaeota archaeon]|nr:M23 family metallopeptidase [Candidatus Pacearchaeota archaeon]